MVDILIQLKGIRVSAKNLSYGIEWLHVDKFVKDSNQRELLLDLLGERMSAIYEYGERKEKSGRKEGRKE